MVEYLGANWDKLMSGYLSAGSSSAEADSDVFTYFIKLKKLLEKRSVNFWHVKYLEKYLQNDFAPYDLRVQIFPQLGTVFNEFKIIWERVLLNCSSGLMRAVITEYLRIIGEIDQELNTLF